jgi:hypothetical protein
MKKRFHHYDIRAVHSAWDQGKHEAEYAHHKSDSHTLV